MLFFRCCIFALLITPLVNAESLIFEQGGNYLSGHYLAPLDNQPAKKGSGIQNPRPINGRP
jgi:hypothetical protein